MNNTNPPAFVRPAEVSLRDLAKRIRPRLRKDATNAMEIGEDMEQVFARVTGRARKDFLMKEFGISERQAWRYLRAHRARDRIRENPSDNLTEGDSLSPSLASAMHALEEDQSQEEVAPKAGSKADLPFSAPATPIREPGSDESYQELLAKRQEVLCNRCKRLKSPGCDACRVRWFRLDNPTPKADQPPVDRPKPAKVQTHEPKNGQPVFDWQDWNGHFGAVVRGIDRLATVGNVPNVRPDLEALRLRAGELLAEFKRVSEAILKQKPPE